MRQQRLFEDDNLYDCRYKHPFRIINAGPSFCGKTEFFLRLLKNANELIDKPECAQNVICFVKEKQDVLENYQDDNLIHVILEEPPTTERIRSLVQDYQDADQGSLIFIDDFLQDISPCISNLFTIHSHHLNVSACLTSQNIFHKNMRTISLNANYLTLFKNVRDKSQIMNLARQVHPHNPRYIVQAFQEATKTKFGHFVLDLHPSTEDKIRFRSDIFNPIGPMVYLEK